MGSYILIGIVLIVGVSWRVAATFIAVSLIPPKSGAIPHCDFTGTEVF